MKNLHKPEVSLSQIPMLVWAIAFSISCGDVGCPPEDIVASPISSNLVYSTDPVAGDVVPLSSFTGMTFNFLKMIDGSTFSVSEDIRVSLQRGDQPAQIISLFDPAKTIFAGTAISLFLYDSNPVPLQPGDVIHVSILGSDQIGNAAVTSLPDYPPGSKAVRLSTTVTVRFTIADPNAGQPGGPTVAAWPAGFVVPTDPVNPCNTLDPDIPDGVYPFVQPHDPLLVRFSEPVGVVNLAGEVCSERAKGSVSGMDFRSFTGLQSKLSGKDHTGIVRNGFFFMVPGTVYEFNIFSGKDVINPALPSTKDLAGNELSETFTRVFRTSHVAIMMPFGGQYSDIDLRNDPVIQSGVMGFSVTDQVRLITAVSGVSFSPVQRNSGDTLYPSASGVVLVPDGSGQLCVAAFGDNGFLGEDCLRVFDEGNLSTVAYVGKEGGSIMAGWFEASFVQSDTVVVLDDGTMVNLPPSLQKAVEVELKRTAYSSISNFSLLDTYTVTIPNGILLKTYASVSWKFEPSEQGLPGDARDLLLGTIDSNGDFQQYFSQLLLPWKKGALVDHFSPTKASSQQKHCNAGFTEKVVCCKDQVLFECERERCSCCKCGLWCCHPADKALCYCSPVMLYCGSGCSTASAESGANCSWDPGAPSECSQADLAQVNKKRCVNCEFSNCVDWSHAVASAEPKAAAESFCVCQPTSGSVGCQLQPDGTTCCGTVGTFSAAPSCTTSVPEWANPPQACVASWTSTHNSIQNHEDEHSRRAEQECNVLVDQLNSIPSQCDIDPNKAFNQLNASVDEILGLFELRSTANQDFVDLGPSWDVPPYQCSCAQ